MLGPGVCGLVLVPGTDGHGSFVSPLFRPSRVGDFKRVTQDAVEREESGRRAMWGPDPKSRFGSNVLPSRLPAVGTDPVPDPRYMTVDCKAMAHFSRNTPRFYHSRMGLHNRHDGIELQASTFKAQRTTTRLAKMRGFQTRT